MAMTEYSGDTDIITNIGTTPQERGLTADEFKAKFDEALTVFVTWFNDTHKTEFDAKAITTTYTATIPSTDWVGESAPYSKEVTVSGMLTTDNPIYDIDLSSAEDYAEEQAILTAWRNVYRIATGTDKITAYATAVPTVDIPIQLKVVR